ncbi:hypothetical protein KM043_016883 [Ampulex compressa]|nr:hypothetical protein KM043_016883 [Ampulex compressa]
MVYRLAAHGVETVVEPCLRGAVVRYGGVAEGPLVVVVAVMASGWRRRTFNNGRAPPSPRSPRPAADRRRCPLTRPPPLGLMSSSAPSPALPCLAPAALLQPRLSRRRLRSHGRQTPPTYGRIRSARSDRTNYITTPSKLLRLSPRRGDFQTTHSCTAIAPQMRGDECRRRAVA